MNFAMIAVAVSLAAGADHWEEFYKDLHRHPELGFKEKRTVGKVVAEFKRIGLKPIELGGGVVAILENGAGPTTLVRADMDALPITEETGLPYSSENAGVMHACGHDVHTTTLLASAEAMLKEKSNWHGTLVFVAQPAEEILKGGQSMFDAGLVAKVPKPDQCVSMHVGPFSPVGKASFPPPGAVMTAADNLDIVFHGRTSHGSAPHKGIDPIVLASEFVIKMQTLVGREVAPLDAAVISVGTIQGGTARNIIADQAKVQLTMRTYDPDTRAHLNKRVREVASGLATAAGAAEPTITVIDAVPSVFNDATLTERFRAGVVKRLGGGAVAPADKIMASEDFSLYGPTFKAPALRWFIGVAPDPKNPTPNHNSKFAPPPATVLPAAVQATVGGLLELHKL